MTPLLTKTRKVEVRLHQGVPDQGLLNRLEAHMLRDGPMLALSRHPGWLVVLARGLGHTPYCLEAVEDEVTRGWLALSYLNSLLFGRFLASLPYLNSAGVLADDDATAGLLIDRAVELADRLGVRRLEVRHEHALKHPKLAHSRTDKVHMRLDLPGTVQTLWAGLKANVRNQVRKGQKNELTVAWGGHDLLSDFYAIFSRNMRDLGTPVYGRSLFAAVLDQFPSRAELCVVRQDKTSVAAALLLHGWGMTEVPSASSLRSHNHTCANMLLYWHLLERAVQRGQDVFDFGRSTPGTGTYSFKKQWGASPMPAEWQYYLRTGGIGDARPDNPRYQRLIRIWQRLPVCLTRLLGPFIVRGIP